MRIKYLLNKLFTKPIPFARKLGVTVGESCKFNGHPSFGSEPYLITIGNHVELSGRIEFITHDGATWVFREKERYKDVIKYGKITIGDNCFIGAQTMILPGVTIGKDSIIGAGSLVTKDVPSGVVVAGRPAKYICTTEEYAEKCLANTPEYDLKRYNEDKKEELLRIL